MLSEAVAQLCLGWYIFIALVCAIGYVQLFFHYYRTPARAAILSKKDSEVPHLTVIRPCKGDEPYLYECLAATFQQDYPKSKLTIQLCVASRQDAAYSTLRKAVSDHPSFDTRVYIEEEDPGVLSNKYRLGPNPKIRNMSRAYREAKGDLIWIIDCNVWLNPGACARMVDKLCGYTHTAHTRPFKLVHHLPISVNVHSGLTPKTQRRLSLSHDSSYATLPNLDSSSSRQSNGFGGMLEELFLSSSHAKMYVAINTVGVAPCIVGKSTMFRRSHLDCLTKGQGIDFFSHNICEDHLIGDLLWRSKLGLNDAGEKFNNHGLVMGDYAIQPVAAMSLANYAARRVRWLRVRKFTVPAATLVEPGTESLLCSFMGAWGATASSHTRDVFGGTWSAMTLWFILSIVLWALVDRTVYLLLHSGLTIENNDSIPPFTKPLKNKLAGRRSFAKWSKAWLARETLALPIWLWAIWGGATVAWREKRFWVGFDMKVHEIKDDMKATEMNGHANTEKKTRLD